MIKSKIADDIKEVVSNRIITTADMSEIEQFKQAMAEFDKLVRDGLVKRRGYNLASVEDIKSPSHTFNICLGTI